MHPADRRLRGALAAGQDHAALATLAPAADGVSAWARDVDAVFARSWLPACHASEVPEVGWRRAALGAHEILVTRGADGLRAYANACPHRGARLLDVPACADAALRCPVHRMTFDPDGVLRSAPHSASFGAVAPALRLRPVRLTVWAGLVFVCLDPDAPPFADTLGPELADLPALAELDALVVHARTERPTPHGWRLAVEGGLENLHLATLHPRTVGPTLDVPASVTVRSARHSAVLAPYRPPSLYDAEGPFGRAAEAAGAARITPPGGVLEGVNLTAFVWPNLSLSITPYTVWVIAAWPDSPTTCRMDHLTLGAPARDAEAAAHYARVHAATAAIMDEDVAAMCAIQAARRDAAPTQPLSGHEVRVAWFREALADAHRVVA